MASLYEGGFKLNVDASVFTEAETFSIGMLVRDHHGSFVVGRTMTLPKVDSVFEAEAIGVKEALSWLVEWKMDKERVQVETDSMLTTKALKCQTLNLMEVGDVIKECCSMMQIMPNVSINFVRNQANKAAHLLARYLCSAYVHVDFTSPPNCLLETLLSDLSK
ncbi:hypothetical protein DCAR_0519453 [Daucus carota subsp. sativus]|uniref:RNase H type-1 domain-containing protein n=1 Tax=Daucus carota subsp. sativus TaxID=79200 RepID=A0AAF1B1C8_DAUCS|nr:hypothetical protein DCAR_0519453 [Daucus carota subsp. sativus]